MSMSSMSSMDMGTLFFLPLLAVVGEVVAPLEIEFTCRNRRERHDERERYITEDVCRE
jgi:hypothetical protein